ncbi:hypothetical protein Tco_1265553 [Tanacetum coccineum]
MLLPGAKAKRLSKYLYLHLSQHLKKTMMKNKLRKISRYRKDIDDELDEQELEGHYMYMEKIQLVLHATYDNFGPTYDTEPLETVHPNDEYNVFATERQNPKQPESINDTYDMEKVDSNATLDSSDMSTNEQGVD